MSSPTLAEFLAARLDELEAAAKATEGHSLFNGSGIYVYPRADGPVTVVLPSHLAIHIALNDPAHVLADVAAKRAILAAYVAAKAAAPSVDHRKPMSYWYELEEGIKVGAADGLEIAVKHDAAAWSDHPDYRAEWKP